MRCGRCHSSCISHRWPVHPYRDAGVFDLAAGDRGPVLGFLLHHDKDELALDLGDDSLQRLRLKLREAHAEHHPVLAARRALHGWVSGMGPAFKSGRKLLPQIGLLAVDHGLREAFHQDELQGLWQRAWGRWCKALMAARRRYQAQKSQEAG